MQQRRDFDLQDVNLEICDSVDFGSLLEASLLVVFTLVGRFFTTCRSPSVSDSGP